MNRNSWIVAEVVACMVLSYLVCWWLDLPFLMDQNGLRGDGGWFFALFVLLLALVHGAGKGGLRKKPDDDDYRIR